MPYTEEKIKKYLDILHNYKVEREGGGGVIGAVSLYLNVQIVQILNFLPLILATKFVMNVVQQTGMY